MSPKNQEINDQAVAWATKKDLGKLTPEECAQLEAWLAADVRHFGAYAKAQAIMARLGRMHGISRFQPVPDRSIERAWWSRRRMILTGGVAASVAAAVVTGISFQGKRGGETFVTEVGQTREIVLGDGSAITLNTHSELQVNFSRRFRRVRLVHGEALFDVAKDKTRPFIVTAGDTEVRAVGTSFTVSLLPSRPIQVLVKEGIVELDHVNSPVVPPIRVSANTKATAPHNAPITVAAVTEVNIARDLAWQHGLIAFENETLQSAAGEFARYSEVRIVVDSSIASRTVTGLFAANDPIGFAKTAAALLKLKVVLGDRQVKISDESVKTP